MSNPNTSQASTSNAGSRNTVLDTFKKVVRIIDADTLPGSLQKVVINSENSQGSTVNSETTVTQFPLHPPGSSYVNFLSKNHHNSAFKFNFTIKADKTTNARTKFKVFYWAPNTLPKSWNVYIDGYTVASSNYSRWEAMATNSSLSSEVVDNDPNYTTLDKLLYDRPCPSATVYFPKGEDSHTFEVIIQSTTDISTVTPFISNFVFWDSSFGSFLYEPDFANMDQALLICPIPDTYTENGTLYLPNFHVLEPQPFNKPFKLTTHTAQPLATGDNTIKASVAGEKVQFTATLNSWSTASNEPLAITQYDMRLTEASRDAIHRFAGSDGMINIPTQHWVSLYANSANKVEGSNTTTFTPSAGNINMVVLGFPYTNSPVYLPNPRFASIQCEICGSVNMDPRSYKAIDARFIKDMSQALLNDDVWGLNPNVSDSLKLLPETGKIYDRDAYAATYSDTSGPIVYRPNHTVFAFEVSPMSDFMRGANTGACEVAPINFSYTTTENLDQGIDQLNPGPVTSSTRSPVVSCLQDVILSLKYDASRKTCIGSEIKFALPRRA